MARAYEMVVRMMNEPTKSRNAVLLPSWIAPKQVHRKAARTVAGTGQLSFSLTCEKKPEKGVALSRARAHHIRPTCLVLGDCGRDGCGGARRTVRKVPSTQIRMERNIIKSRPNVAPLLPVAWE